MEEESFGADQADVASDRTLNSSQCPSLFSIAAEQESHKEERPYKCNQCDKSYRHAGSLVNHKKTHQIGLYTCLICQKEFSNPMGLKSHLRTHSEDKRFKCEQCGEAFRMSQQLYNHRRSSHGFSSVSGVASLARNPKVDVQAPILVDSSNLISNLENYIAESVVPGDFSPLVSKYYQDGDSSVEEPAKADIGTQQGSAEEAREEQAPNDNTEEYRYKCNQCGKAYKHAGSLANHRQSHMVGLYQCAICFKEFSNLMAMKNHCRLHSDSRARQRCRSPRYSAKIGPPLGNTDTLQSDILHPSDTMDRHEDLPAVSQIPESSNYQEDPEEFPSPTQKLQEDLHPDSFPSEQVLQLPRKDSMIQVEENTVDHNSTFTSEEEETGQMSEQQQSDEALEEGKPEDSENRPFRCVECGKTYRHAGSLINHRKTHQTGVYSCPLCSKQMFNVAALNNHFRAHFKSRTGRKVEDNYFHSADLFQNPEDPFQCRICDQYLPNESDFLQHQLIHQEEAIKETYCDTQNREEPLESGTYWPENPQVSQSNNDSCGSSMPNPVKLEMEDLAQQQTPLDQWTNKDTTPLEGMPQNNGAKIQDTSSDFEQLTLDQTVFKEESSQLEGHDNSLVERPYKCEPCGRTYRHKSSLINHKLTHKTGIYQCSLCPKQYSNLMALRNHLRFHSRSYAGRRGILSRRGRQYLRGRPRFLQNKTVHPLAETVKVNENISPQTDANNEAVEGTLSQISCPCGESFDHTERFHCHSQMCQKSTQVFGSVEPSIEPKKDETLLTDPQNADRSPEKLESQVQVVEASEHQGRRVYECDLCNKSYRHSGSLINHKRTHQTGDYMCPYCSRHVHNMAALKNHIRIHHKVKKSQPEEMRDCSRFLYPDHHFPHLNAKNLFGCVSCEEIFHSEEDLVAHQMVHMALEGDCWEQKVQDASTAEDDKNVSLENVSDSEWERSNSSIHGAENHGSRELIAEDYSNHIDYTCVECGEVYTSIEDLNNHKLTHQIGIYQCSFCPKEFPNLPALRDHFQSHTKPHAFRNVGKDNSSGTDSNEIVQEQLAFDIGYDCGHCGSIFSNEVDFHQHQVAHEKQVKEKSLPALDPEGKEAEFSFPMDSSERELLRKIKCELEEADHTEAPDSGSQLSHICGYCGQTYDDLESLQAHSLSHGAEEKTLENEGICSDVEHQENDLQETPPLKEEDNSDETAKYEEGQENRPYSCNQCGKSYRHIGSLGNHKKTHLVGHFQCIACSKQYPNMAAYINHMRHHPECKQQVAENSQHEANGVDLHGSPFITGEGEHLKVFPSASPPDPSASDVLPSDIKPCINDLCIDNSCLDHSSTQMNFQTPQNHSKIFMKRCLRQGEERIDPVTSLHHKGGSTSGPFGAGVDDKSLQTREFTGKTIFGVKSLSVRIAGNYKKDSETGLIRPSKENIKAEEGKISSLASSSHNKSEVEGGYCGQTYDGLVSLQSHSLSQGAEEKLLANENSDADNQNNDLQQTPSGKEEENSDETAKNEEGQENRPYTCDQCGKSYRHGGSLVNHKKTHLVGNFQCVACSKQYPNMAAYINHLRHHPECKQQAAVISQREANASEFLGSPYVTGEGGHLNVFPSGPLLDPPPDVLPSDFKPCIDTLSIDNSSLDYSSSQMNFQTPRNQAKASRKGFLKQGKKRNYPVTSTPLKGGSASVTHGSDANQSFQACEFSGKTFFGVKTLSLRLAGNGKNSSELQLLRPSEETIKAEEDTIPSMVHSSPNQNEVEGGFHQRPFRCEVCGRSYRHAGSLINHKQTHKTGVFRCSICQKRFFNLMAMKNHNRIHFELKRHKCLDCGKAFRLRKQLDTHQRLHWQRAAVKKSGRRNRRSTRCRKFAPAQQLKATSPCEDIALDQVDRSGKNSSDSSVKRELDPDSRPYQCEECGRSYRHAGSLFNHKKSHKMGQYCCPICRKTYSNLMAMKNHERNHYEAKRHHCLQCGKSFKWKRLLTRHQFVHAQEESQPCSKPAVGERKASTVHDKANRSIEFCKRSRKSSSPISTNSRKIPRVCNNAPPTKELVCTSCGILFTNTNELTNHACSETFIKMPNSENDELEKPTLSKEDEERPYGCDLCGRTYRHAGSLLNHKNTHKKGLYKCSLCNKQFFNPMAIKNHLRTHTSKKKFQSKEREKVFQSSQELGCRNRVHPPFLCPICHREFNSKLTFKRHQRTHKKNNSFRSSSLAMPSDEETNLSKSNVSDSCMVEPTQVSSPTQERKYKCNQCDRSYRHASSLFNHKKTHSTGVYTCPNCLKEFFNLMAYNNHLRIHKYPCKDCGKAFRIAGHLAAHRKIHEQEGHLTCSLCDKWFFSKSSFEDHQLTHNGPTSDVLEPQPVSSLMIEVT